VKPAIRSAALPLSDDSIARLDQWCMGPEMGTPDPITPHVKALVAEVMSLRSHLAAMREMPRLKHEDLRMVTGWAADTEHWLLKTTKQGYRIYDENGLEVGDVWGGPERRPDAERLVLAPQAIALLRRIAYWSIVQHRKAEGRPGLPGPLHAAVSSFLMAMADPNVEREYGPRSDGWAQERPTPAKWLPAPEGGD